MNVKRFTLLLAVLAVLALTTTVNAQPPIKKGEFPPHYYVHLEVTSAIVEELNIRIAGLGRFGFCPNDEGWFYSADPEDPNTRLIGDATLLYLNTRKTTGFELFKSSPELDAYLQLLDVAMAINEPFFQKR